jgi:hypothetical protein
MGSGGNLDCRGMRDEAAGQLPQLGLSGLQVPPERSSGDLLLLVLALQHESRQLDQYNSGSLVMLGRKQRSVNYFV